ncbi:MAG: hypothetical protein H8D45_05350 [Bacteroidetes bacterium]|nr:hypothetical protein [Bacteroidota bacterium]MBL7104215.1 hypothetical protein [Bacteroidales bacterium]
MTIKYLNDANGNISDVQIPFNEWEKILWKINKYEQTLKIKDDLTEAFEEVKKMREGKIKKQTLSEFLNEL